MKKAVIYARYSCDAQTEQSIEGQLRVCKEYAQNNDILIVDTYIDRAMSGTNDMRPDFQRMLRDSAKRQWEIVLVYKLDRFSRDKYEATIHKHTLRENGVKLVSAMEKIPDSPEGIILESLLEGMNQYYSAELKQKVNRGLRESWSKGQTTGGKAVFGYDVVDKRCVINPYESKIVIEAFTQYAKGYTAPTILENFAKMGYRRKNGKPLNLKYLYDLLHDARYTGIVEHQGVVYDNIFPRIVPDDLWKAVSAITEENKLAPCRKKEICDFILSGKLFCGNCKRRMAGVSGRSKTGTTYYYYDCLPGRAKKKTCTTRAIKKQEIEDIVVNTTARLLGNASVVHEIAIKIFKLHQTDLSDNTAIRALEQKQRDVLRAKTNMIRAIEQGIITDSTKSRLTELETELALLDVEIEKEKNRNYSYLTVEQIEDYLRTEVFESPTDIEVRKLLVNTFVREVLLYEDRIVISYNFTEEFPDPKKPKEKLQKIEDEISETEPSFLSDRSSKQSTCLPPKTV